MNFIIAILTLASMNAFAGSKLTLTKQKEIVEEIAKGARKRLWILRHENVESAVTLMDRELLNDIIKDEEYSYEPLERGQISELYKCIHTPKFCHLFLIDISASYMSGSGHDRIWVLMNPYTGNSRKIYQSVYSE